MALAIVHSRAVVGINALPVQIEAHLTPGVPSLSIVGLAEKAVKESKDRVRSAIINSAFDFPIKRITLNLAPADLPKEGGRFDLAIAVGILIADKQLFTKELDKFELIGELGLSGELRPVRGVLPMAIAVRESGRQLILPMDNAKEAALVSNLKIFPAKNLLDAVNHLKGFDTLDEFNHDIPEQAWDYPDLKDVKGQQQARRALEITAAGGHSLLMCGPPGTGKTMLAQRLLGILPPLTEQEALEAAAIESISRAGFSEKTWKKRPFQTPHHTASSAALVGGGRPPQPGEISLSHQGVLFLDELPEFSRVVLDALREPLEEGKVTISRAAFSSQFPAKFQLITAMNPCPCGYCGDPSGRCRCTHDQVQRYQSRISGPFLDRIDIHITVPQLPHDIILSDDFSKIESSATVKQRVLNARQLQKNRNVKINAAYGQTESREYCHLEQDSKDFMQQASERHGFSARAYHRLIKVARTIADLDQSEQIDCKHLTEAVMYRPVSTFQGASSGA